MATLLFVVAAVVIVFVRELCRGHQTGFLGSVRGALARFRRVVAAQLLAILGLFLLAITVVGLPVTIYKYVSWLFVQQEVLFTPLDRAVLDKLREADLDHLAPLDALNLLAQLKRQIS